LAESRLPSDVWRAANLMLNRYGRTERYRLLDTTRAYTTAFEPEVIEQLGIWATELAGMAADPGSRAVQPEMAE
jgi:hypothetical protein